MANSRSAGRRPGILVTFFFVALAFAPLTACGDTARLSVEAGTGPRPELPAPMHDALPTIKVAPAKRWAEGEKPVAASGLAVAAFADGFDHPRWLYVLPNGDVLAAETNAPPKPDDGKGIRGFVQGLFMKRAGATVPSANRITLLRDTDGDGVADQRSVFLSGLNSPFGMALIGNDFYVADTDAVLRFPYHPGDTKITGEGVKIADLPAGTINHHWTKNIIASADGKYLYATVGSNSNVGENGVEAEEGRAQVRRIDIAAGQAEAVSTGVRNPNGLSWQPESGKLWTVANERDELGSDLVPDYLTEVKPGAFYGWPYSYYGQHVDERMKPPRPDLVAKAIPPDYALGPHVAALGLTFYTGKLLPAHYTNGAFIGLHGSWNREPPSGYKVIFVPFAGGQPSGMPEDILTGFIDGEGNAKGRPVGVAVDRQGALLVADDVGNVVWRVTPAAR